MIDLLDKELLSKLGSLRIILDKPVKRHGQGERRSVNKGSSLEFADYRNYTKGDDPRLIDWNIYGRHNQLFLKLHENEEDMALYMFVDSSLSMGLNNSEKLNYAKKLASALGYITVKNNERLFTAYFSDRIRRSFRDSAQAQKTLGLFKFLSAVEPEGDSNLLASLNSYLKVQKRFNGLIALISDGFFQDDISKALNLLGSMNCPVIFFHLISPSDIEPPLEGSIRIVDIETREKKEITINRAIIGQYNEELESWLTIRKQQFESRGMKYVKVMTDKPLEELLLKKLRSKGILA